MNYTGLGIHLKVRDIAVSREFYEGLLGLTPTRAAGTEAFRRTLPATLPPRSDDGLPGASDRWNCVTYEPSPTAPLEICDGHPAVLRPEVFLQPVVGPKVSAMLHAESLVPLVRDRGARPTFPTRVYPWGTVELVLEDPDGFVIVVIAPAADSEIEALGQLVRVDTYGHSAG